MAEQTLLLRRAERYARVPVPTADASKEIVVFSRDQLKFCLPLSSMAEIRTLAAVSPIPGTPPHIPGAFFHRGEILSLHDLSVYLGVAQSGATSGATVLIVHDRGRRLGLLADGDLVIGAMADSEVHSLPVNLAAHEAMLPGLFRGSLLIHVPGLFETPRFFRAFP